MPTFVNPTSEIDDLVGFFEISADEGGVFVDAALCERFAEGLAELGEKLEALVAFARAMGLVEMMAPPPRTPTERAQLARKIAAEAGDAGVVVLPGGTAA